MTRDLLVAYVWFWACRLRKKGFLISLPVLVMHKSLGLFFNNDLSTKVMLPCVPDIHHAFGIIVGNGVVFEGRVLLRAHVCLGESSTGLENGPTVGDSVEFGVGAVVVGNFDLVQNKKIPPNSFLRAL